MSSEKLLTLLIILSFCWVSVAITDPTDLVALRSLKEQWQNTPPNWVKHDPCGQRWEGIHCHESRVIRIILSGNNIAGQLPQDITLLSELQTLDLSNNKGLTGPLPSNIGNLKNLVSLVLVGCKFSGSIPVSIGSLQKLTHLFLNSNNFTGNIPNSIGNLTNLVWLDLTDNQLDGVLPVSNRTMPGLDMLQKAQHFHLGQNKLSGVIPIKLFSSRMSLMHLILNDNQLTGRIPETLGLVRTLTVIRLDKNILSGSIPQNLSMLTSMGELYLSNNLLSGSIPDLTGMNLQFLDLSNNSFNSAPIPQWFQNLSNLTTLVMEKTRLEGQLSTGLLSLPQLQTLVLKNNELNGTVNLPSNMSSNLRFLDLSNNFIDGFISSRGNNQTVMLDDNPFCLKPEASGICNTVEPSNISNFTVQPSTNSKLPTCAPLTCFLDSTLSSRNCKRPYLGYLIFRSFSFSDLENMSNYVFLTNNLQPFLSSHGVEIGEVCLVSSLINVYGYLVLSVSFFPPSGAYFNRTGIASIGNILNNQLFRSPYGPYYFSDLSYTGFPEQNNSIGVIIGVTICSFVLVVLALTAGAYAYRQRKRAQRADKLNNPFSSWSEGKVPMLRGVKWFSFEDVKQCTNNFSHESEIGVGGYGKVYKGKLESGEIVAIKRAQQGSLQGAHEFKTEIELLSRVHHKNVVNLVGFCYDKGEQMLIYEFVPNGSLRAALSGKSKLRLEWTKRLKIGLGAARGLAYLHELADPPIIHRDVKSDNILLSDHLNAKVADFGLSILLSDGDIETTQVKGTRGYLDPEYYATQILTEKSDVYSFGVVLLELVTGRSPLEDNKYVVRLVRETLKETGNAYNIVDPTIRSESDALKGVEELVKLAMQCLRDTGDERPSMSEVVKEIEKMIDEYNMNYDVESVTTSMSYNERTESDYPYTSNSNVSFDIGSSPMPILR